MNIIRALRFNPLNKTLTQNLLYVIYTTKHLKFHYVIKHYKKLIRTIKCVENEIIINSYEE